MSEYGRTAKWGHTQITIDCEIAGGKTTAGWELEEVDTQFVDDIINAVKNLRWRQERRKKREEKQNEQKA